MLTFPPAAPGPDGAGGPTRFFISAAIVMNACSTFVAFLAEVSKNGMPNWSAYSYNLKTIFTHILTPYHFKYYLIADQRIRL